MRFQFTHFISIYEIIKNPHDGGKMITLEKKKKQLKESLYPPRNRATV